MADTFQLLFDGQPADDDFYTAMGSLEVEENADLPGAIKIRLPVSLGDSNDLTYVNDSRLKPFTNLAVVVTPDGKDPQCIFDGYVLAHKLHLETGVTSSTLEVWGQDSTWLMNLEEKVHEWVDITDADVANSIFSDYGIDPADENTEDDSPSHTEDTHSLMQRSSDIQFLRSLAHRNGKLCRVSCNGTPGQRSGYFAKPNLDGDAVITLTLNDPEDWTVSALDFEWDVTRPSAVVARQALLDNSDEDGVSADTNDAGLALLDQRGLADFSGKEMKVLLAAPADSAEELSLRAQALLRDSGWFARCEGETDLARLNEVIRVGTVVGIQGVGALNSGKYYVWSVRHHIDADTHTMKFVLLRNAAGPEASGSAASLLGGLV